MDKTGEAYTTARHYLLDLHHESQDDLHAASVWQSPPRPRRSRRWRLSPHPLVWDRRCHRA